MSGLLLALAVKAAVAGKPAHAPSPPPPVAAPAPAPPPPTVKVVCPVSTSIEGKFVANDKGTYWLRVNGPTIWWIGLSPDNGQSWSNVFKGTRKGDKVSGQWADMGDGARALGTMVLKVTANNQLEKVAADGDTFGAAVWLRPGCTYTGARNN